VLDALTVERRLFSTSEARSTLAACSRAVLRTRVMLFGCDFGGLVAHLADRKHDEASGSGRFGCRRTRRPSAALDQAPLLVAYAGFKDVHLAEPRLSVGFGQCVDGLTHLLADTPSVAADGVEPHLCAASV
jgi:hypothetical protein